jgi:hypothetical protein
MASQSPYRVSSALLGATLAFASRTTHAGAEANDGDAGTGSSSSAPASPDDASPTSAAPGPGDDARSVSLRVGAGYMRGLTEATIGAGPGMLNVDEVSFLELSISPQWQVAPDVALGPRLSHGIELPDRSGSARVSGVTIADRHLWQVRVTGRYQAVRNRGLYLGMGTGAAAMVDSVGGSSATNWGFSVEALAGFDLELTQSIALGLELRAAHALLPDDYSRIGSNVESPVVGYGATTWLALDLVGSVGL